MDWICHVFTLGKQTYLVASKSTEDAWKMLASRQSCNVESCKKYYRYKGYMDSDSGVWKL